MKTVLVIEDDKIISQGLSQALRSEGYEVLCAFDGESGLHLARTSSPDLVILDIMMPEMNGFEVTMELRRHGQSFPVIIISAKVDSKDKVRGLDLGADDYITKPFDLSELLARVRRWLKRQNSHSEEFGDFKYDWDKRLLYSGDRSVSLSTKERKLLEFFLKRKGQIVSREQILENVWDSDYSGTDRTVDNAVVSLRKIVGGEYLLTERGLGYRFVTKP